MRTPWGYSDSKEPTSNPDVTFYGTPSHGGFHVKGKALDRIPPEYHVGFAGETGWYEEDCDWAIVARFFPELFTAEEREHAENTIRHYHPCGLAA